MRGTNFQSYPAYKDSGVEWIGEIPEKWSVKRLKYLLKEMNIRSSTGEERLLSLSKYLGVVPKSSLEARAGQARTLVGYKVVQPDQLVINKMQAVNGLLAVSKISGITSPDYSIYKSLETSAINIRYVGYLLSLNQYLAEFKRRVTGVMEGFIRLYTDDLFDITVQLPSLSEQSSIVDFLGKKCKKIDSAIEQKEEIVELLKERKQIVTQNAVTKGINPNVKMKGSGVEWSGEIPEHWKVKRLKYILDERKERSKTGEEPLFMVSQVHGLVLRSDFHEKAEVAESNVDNKIVYKNDLVFNKLKAHLGVFFKSRIDYKGLVSPDYAVYKSNGCIEDLKFLEILFRHPAYIGQFIIRATGIVEGLIRLYTDDLFEIPVPVPPADEQLRVLKHIELEATKIDKAVELQQKQIEKLKEYKATLINSAVTGKIKVS
jgi:type I restriction enzyme, S subunit